MTSRTNSKIELQELIGEFHFRVGGGKLTLLEHCNPKNRPMSQNLSQNLPPASPKTINQKMPPQIKPKGPNRIYLKFYSY